MLDAIQKLFESNVISNEIKESIETAWETRINENKNQVATQLREEFAQKYEHDKNTMLETIDRMISEQLSSEITEFVDDRKQLAEMKIGFAKKLMETPGVVKKFVANQLATEVKELHEDQKQMVNKFGQLEHFVVEALAQEITEFYKDKQEVTETKVKLLREGRREIQNVKEQFVRRASVMVENVVKKGLRSEITALKEDIEAARRIEFGRKLFEAFAAEYQTSYLNEKTETSKLLKIIESKDLAMKEAAHAVLKAEKLIDSNQKEIRALKESQERKGIIAELLAPLNKEQKSIMNELMKGVKTSKLNESFEKYLPAVIAGKPTQPKTALLETKEITGNKVSNNTNSREAESNIFDIRRLAGL